MNETHYLVDNNALLALGRARRATSFFQVYCHLSEDVSREAGDRDDLASVGRVEVTGRTLEHLGRVMAGLAPGETDLVDLYQNKGMADPVLIATAMTLLEQEGEVLIPYSWVIVTADKALAATAAQYQLDTLTPPELAEIIDDATSTSGRR